MSAGPGPAGRAPRMLEFRSGGWVLLLGAILVAGAVAWRLAALWPSIGHAAIGDGEHVESYRFDLSNLNVPPDQLVAGGLARDGLPALVNPATIRADQVAAGSRLAGVRVLHDSDPVVGVAIDGRARAYPVWILAWHEVVNDTLAGEPILITYSGPCDSSVVFDRRAGGEPLNFGVSGLLYNSNLVFYDRREARGDPGVGRESLWSQLLFRAIAGPAAAAGATLELIPCAVVPWGEWRSRHPQTDVLLPDPARARVYKRDPYLAYLGSPTLQFPVDPLPAGGAIAFKTPIIAVREADGWHVRPADSYDRAPDSSGRAAGSLAGGSHPAASRPGSHEPITIRALWFAWYAMHPDSIVDAVP